jgi:hypothetical protein
MDVHQKSTTFCLFDPSAAKDGSYRTVTRPTTAEGIREVLKPLDGRCQVAFEVGTQAQWVAQIVRSLASDVQVANPTRSHGSASDVKKRAERVHPRTYVRGMDYVKTTRDPGHHRVPDGPAQSEPGAQATGNTARMRSSPDSRPRF